MDTRLRTAIVDRLLSAEGPDDETVITLVDAACESEEALDRALGGEPRVRPKPSRPPAPGEPVEAPGAYLASITVAGFRGVGAEATVTLHPGPGLTLIVGRNGSGKSSFAEGLETLLTGTSGRWKDRRSKLWREGWRNLHADGAARVAARFVVEGQGPLEARRSWPVGADVDDGRLVVGSPGGGETSLAALGWDAALEELRPFLSYPELGALVDEPSKAFDALHRVLGLDEVVDARDRLADRRKARDAKAKALRSRAADLRAQLAPLAEVDGRAAEALEALGTGKGRSRPDLGALAALVTGGGGGDDDPLAPLRRLAALEVPPADAFTVAAASLREAHTARVEARDATAVHHGELVRLLDEALPWLEAPAPEGVACPVCERPMSADAVAAVRRRLDASRASTARLDAAERAARDAGGDAAALLGRVPTAAFRQAVTQGLVDVVPDVLSVPAPGPEAGLDALATHLERVGAAVPAAAARVRDAAAARLAEHDDRFQAVAVDIAAWLGEAREVETAAATLKSLKDAEKWLGDAEGALRDARFAPIAAQVLATWRELGEQSSVSLAGVRLEGKATRRRIDLDVTVDGARAAAVGVMSQGELNAMALSLFLPRMMLGESPFRFLVIDDPVQAMDPHKVDGLARVLEGAARTRQVVVLTHDARLVEAVRRLQIDARVLRVERRGASAVEVVPHRDPVKAYLEDARQLLRAEAELGRDIVRSVVPGFCRSAVEAAALETVRRRRLDAGEDHGALEARLDECRTTQKLVAFALFDDPERGGAVLKELNAGVGRTCADAYQAMRKCAHGGPPYDGDVHDLVKRTRDLAAWLEKRP